MDTVKVKAQKRGKRIAMSRDEMDDFLAKEHTCRVASVNPDGGPHVTPMWFAWDGECLWLNSIVDSQRWVNFQRDPRVSVVVDSGIQFEELRGVEIQGRVAPMGEAPRTDKPHPVLESVERIYGNKYKGGRFVPDGRHAWLRVAPEKIISWDFRKMER